MNKNKINTRSIVKKNNIQLLELEFMSDYSEDEFSDTETTTDEEDLNLSFCSTTSNGTETEQEIEEDTEQEIEEDTEQHLDKIKVKIAKQNNKELNRDNIIIDKEKLAFLKNIEKQINTINKKNNLPIKYKILDSNLDLNTKAILIKNLELYDTSEDNSTEYIKYKHYVNSILDIPFKKYINFDTDIFKDPSDTIINSKKILDNTTFGHNNIKNELLEIISYQIINGKSNNKPIGLYGPPGIGKTSIIKNGFSKILNRPFHFISLSGINDVSFFDGHSYTYEGSKHGIIVDILKKSKCMNPIIYFDELDKISKTDKGDEITNLLIHITDETQNTLFTDKYFDNIDIDLSQITFIFSFNDINNINPILRDRIHLIELKDFNKNDKLKICNDFFIKDLYNEFNFNSDLIYFPKTSLEYLYNKYNNDNSGLRYLKNLLKSIFSKLGMIVVTNFNDNILKLFKLENYKFNDTTNIIITPKLIDILLIDVNNNTNNFHTLYS